MRLILISIMSFLYFSCAVAQEKYKTPLTQDTLDAVGIFLALDFAALLDNDPRKKIISKYFYIGIMYKDNEPYKVKAEDEEDLKYIKSLGLEEDKYESFFVITEINEIGAVVRYLMISSKGQILWSDRIYSLLNFDFQSKMGWMKGAVPLFKLPSERISHLFSQCQRGEIKFDYKPTKEEMELFKRKLNAFFYYAASRE